MAWTGLPADNGTDWTAVDFLNQFVDAINERVQASSGYPVNPVQAGDDVQAAAFIASLQTATELLVPQYLNPARIDFSVRDLDYANWFWTLADWRQAAGIHADGFERRHPREITSTSDPGQAGQVARMVNAGPSQPSPDAGRIFVHDGSDWVLSADQSLMPDVVTEYGTIEAGDYIGPWLWNELQAGLNLLTTRLYGMTAGGTELPGADQLYIDEFVQEGSYDGPTSWAASRAQADANYPLDNRAGTDSHTANGTQMWYRSWDPPTAYSAAKRRTQFNFAIPIDPAQVNFGAVFKVYLLAGTKGMWTGSMTDRHVFDALGQSVVQDQWSLFWQGQAASVLWGNRMASGYLGDLTAPPWGADPDPVPEPPDGVSNSSRGWNIATWNAGDYRGAVVVAEFGFEYAGS